MEQNRVPRSRFTQIFLIDIFKSANQNAMEEDIILNKWCWSN